MEGLICISKMTGRPCARGSRVIPAESRSGFGRVVTNHDGLIWNKKVVDDLSTSGLYRDAFNTSIKFFEDTEPLAMLKSRVLFAICINSHIAAMSRAKVGVLA